ncbi:hypothetical protein RHMOL_Rhmol10G0215700 [Rhododendron molle]|uniref:Uncharacterized protein n=1 Tax=Rhododendron molle TaxID=49168 RepID=A0ACC0M512_RHOML|nr:hypothetical protein RHMOL_Rhmol10G0215700 [Rhododendron molle]
MLSGSGLRYIIVMGLRHTFVPVLLPTEHKAWYRSRKGDYTDSRMLQNALIRPHGLRIPQGMCLENLSISEHASAFM